MSFNYDSSAMNASDGGGGGIEMVQLNKGESSGTPASNGGLSTALPQTPKTPRKILSQGSTSSTHQTPKKQLQFSTPECHTVPPSPISLVSPKIMMPNRKREEAIVMANLRKKVPAFDLTRRKIVSGGDAMNNNDGQLDNRPTLPKISSKTSISLMDNNNNNNCTTNYEDVKDKDFILELLCWHNEFRARHAVTALSISTELCEYAQTWANHLSTCNEFYYRSDKTIGQNLFCCPVSALVSDLTGQEVASFWYSTVRRYNYYKESHLLHTNSNAGHFSQMIWASSKYLGVGKAASPKTGKIFVVAFYFPPGNIVDAYHRNVPPPVENGAGNSSPKLIDGDNNPIPSILKQ